MNGIQKVRIGMRIVASTLLFATPLAKATSQIDKSAGRMIQQIENQAPAKLLRNIENTVVKPQQTEVGVPAKLLHKLKRTLNLGVKYDNFARIFQGNHVQTLVKDLHKKIPAGYEKFAEPLTFQVVEKNNQQMIAVINPGKIKKLTRKEYLKELENPSAKPAADTSYFSFDEEGLNQLKEEVETQTKNAKCMAGRVFRIGYKIDEKVGMPEDFINLATQAKGDGVTPNAFRFVKVKGKTADFSQIMGNPFHKVTEGPNMYTFNAKTDAKTNKLKGKALK